MDQTYTAPPERAEWQTEQWVSQTQPQAAAQMRQAGDAVSGRVPAAPRQATTPVRMSRHKMQAGC